MEREPSRAVARTPSKWAHRNNLSNICQWFQGTDLFLDTIKDYRMKDFSKILPWMLLSKKINSRRLELKQILRGNLLSASASRNLLQVFSLPQFTLDFENWDFLSLMNYEVMGIYYLFYLSVLLSSCILLIQVLFRYFLIFNYFCKFISHSEFLSPINLVLTFY